MLCLRCLETSVSDVSTHHTAPWGGFEPPTWRLHRTPRFPAGVDYLFAIALQALGAGRIVSEPSQTFVRAWLRIAMATTRRRFPAIHPVTPLSFPKGLPLTTSRSLYH